MISALVQPRYLYLLDGTIINDLGKIFKIKKKCSSICEKPKRLEIFEVKCSIMKSAYVSLSERDPYWQSNLTVTPTTPKLRASSW